MPTPRDQLTKRERDAEAAFEHRPEDGLVVGCLRWFFGWDGWRWPMFSFAKTCLRWNGKLDRAFSNDEDADLAVRWAMDYFLVAASVLNLSGYVLTFVIAEGWLAWPPLVIGGLLWLGPLIGAYRIVNLFGVFVQLHLSEHHRPSRAMRAVVHAVWHFVEIIIAFASFYLVAAQVTHDSFGSSDGEFLGSLINPIYFSMVTVATVGYGDFSPTSAAGKLLVMCEIFLGLVLTVVVIQRAVAATHEGKGGSTRHNGGRRGSPQGTLPSTGSAARSHTTAGAARTKKTENSSSQRREENSADCRQVERPIAGWISPIVRKVVGMLGHPPEILFFGPRADEQ